MGNDLEAVKVLIMKVEGEIQTIRIVSAEKLFYGLL